MRNPLRISTPKTSKTTSHVAPVAYPAFQLRMIYHGNGNTEMTIWQTPSLGTPHIKAPVCMARLQGRVLDLVELYVLRILKQAGVRLVISMHAPETHQETHQETHKSPKLHNQANKTHTGEYRLEETAALRLGLLFRTLAPMRSRDNISRVAQAIEAMPYEEAAYWLGMALYRKNPRRVLTALRVLLSDPYHGNH
ncbi:MAG: hypothetical protein H7707_02450 [Acetobacter sp.]|nr:hypothetical protein [Acetobacter sp.]